MQVRFRAADLGTGSIIEAAVDDIEIISLDPSSGPIGVPFCGPAAPNSTGFPGIIGAIGTTDISENNVRLFVANLPANQFGFFLNGTMTGTLDPVGSDGTLCLAGSVGRYNRLSEIFNTGTFGTGELLLDMNDSPTPFGRVVVTAGQNLAFPKLVP